MVNFVKQYFLKSSEMASGILKITAALGTSLAMVGASIQHEKNQKRNTGSKQDVEVKNPQQKTVRHYDGPPCRP